MCGWVCVYKQKKSPSPPPCMQAHMRRRRRLSQKCLCQAELDVAGNPCRRGPTAPTCRRPTSTDRRMMSRMPCALLRTAHRVAPASQRDAHPRTARPICTRAHARLKAFAYRDYAPACPPITKGVDTLWQQLVLGGISKAQLRLLPAAPAPHLATGGGRSRVPPPAGYRHAR